MGLLEALDLYPIGQPAPHGPLRLTDGLDLAKADEGSALALKSSAKVALMSTRLASPAKRSKLIRNDYEGYHQQRKDIEGTLVGPTGRPDLEALAHARRLVGADQAMDPGRKGELECIIDKVEAEHLLKEKLRAMRGRKGVPDFDEDKFENLYKMFIDRSQLEGEDFEDMQFYFENERGYLAAAMNGFTRMLETLGEEVTADAFMSLHDTCVHKVQDRNNGQALAQGWRDEDHGTGYPIAVGEDGNFSEAGLQAIKEKVATGAWHRLGVVDAQGERQQRSAPEPGDQLVHLVCTPQTAEACKQKVQGVLDEYHASIEDAVEEDDKLAVIARCCQELDQAHAFADGNIRVIAFVLLNKLLIENGLSPTILREPNRFDGYSVGELVADIKEGQQNFGDELL